MEINQPFRAQLHHGEVFTNIPSKIYFMSLLDRENVAKYQWNHSPLKQDEVKAGIERLISPIDIPHIVVASPHVTAMFRYGDPRQGEKETNICRPGIYETASMKPQQGQAIACLAEWHIVSLERRFWEDSNSVEDYLQRIIEPRIISNVQNPNKLREYLLDN